MNFVEEVENNEKELTPVEELVVEDAKENSNEIKTAKKSKKQKVKKAGKVKETVSELKKVTWPTFGKVVKQTIVVLTITFVFLIVVFGIDYILHLLYDLLTKKM